jgi:hypothetical protein
VTRRTITAVGVHGVEIEITIARGCEDDLLAVFGMVASAS